MTSKLTRDRLAEIAQFGFSSAITPANDFEIKELARMALAAMDSEPVKRVNADQMHHVCLEANRHLDKYGAMAKEVNKLLWRIPAQPAPVVPVVPDELLKEYLRLVQCMLSDYRDGNYGNAQRWIRHIAKASDDFERKHGISPWEMARKTCRAAMLAAAPQEVTNGK